MPATASCTLSSLLAFPITRRQALGIAAGIAAAQASHPRRASASHSPDPPAAWRNRLMQEIATPTGMVEYVDPQGRFSFPVPDGWTVDEMDGYVTLRVIDGDLDIGITVVASSSAQEGLLQGWQIIDSAFDPAASEPDVLEVESEGDIDETIVLTYDLGQTSGQVSQGVGLRVGKQVFAIVITGNLQTVMERQNQINLILTGFTILTGTETDLNGTTPLPLEGERLTTFETFVRDALTAFGIPGCAIAVVQDEKLAYANGFGVTEQDGDIEVTANTLMMAGSVTKSFTTMMMGTLVDAGKIAWDQPVVEIMPEFAVSNPTLTPVITMRDLVCACVGIPRRDHELTFNSDELSAEDVIASVADLPFYTPVGESYQYNNQVVAAAGYIAALADGGVIREPPSAYIDSLQRRVLHPVAMPRTGTRRGRRGADDDHALPHGVTLDARYQPLDHMDVAVAEVPTAPSGGLWSSANDLARYIITQLQNGVGPEEDRVISAENLEKTWTPQVPITTTASYGLGWRIDQWKGLRIVGHGGNTTGYTSDVAFVPDVGIGVAVLVNAQNANVITGGIRQRLLEIVFEQPNEVEPELKAALDDIDLQRAALPDMLAGPLDPNLARSLAGDYANPALGPVTISVVNGNLVADAGEFRVRLQPLRESPPQGPALIVADPPYVGWLCSSIPAARSRASPSAPRRRTISSSACRNRRRPWAKRGHPLERRLTGRRRAGRIASTSSSF